MELAGLAQPCLLNLTHQDVAGCSGSFWRNNMRDLTGSVDVRQGGDVADAIHTSDFPAIKAFALPRECGGIQAAAPLQLQLLVP